jgi:hypothetical protein
VTVRGALCGERPRTASGFVAFLTSHLSPLPFVLSPHSAIPTQFPRKEKVDREVWVSHSRNIGE